MKKAPQFATLVLSLFLVGTVGVYLRSPSLALKPLYQFYLMRSGLKKVTRLVQGQTVSYYEGGAGPDLMLLHGFGDSKDSFVQAAQWLVPHYHVILPDMGGFGESAERPELNYSIRSQVERMKALVDALGITQADWVGNSMGGHISAAFTLRYPGWVKKLVVLSPAGLRVDNPTPYEPVTKPMETEEDFDRYMRQVFYKTPWIPSPFKKDFISKSRARFDWYNRIRKDIRAGDDYILNDRIAEIHSPTLIVWGKHDDIVHPVHAPVWRAKIKNSTLMELEDAGHSPQYEMPEKTANWVLEFLRSN